MQAHSEHLHTIEKGAIMCHIEWHFLCYLAKNLSMTVLLNGNFISLSSACLYTCLF